LDNVVDADEFDEDRGPAFYGNVGRCLHLMGQIDPALVCYKKSAILLQSDRNYHVENQGFIRSWVGQLLLAKGDVCGARYLIRAAKLKWELVNPQRNVYLEELLAEFNDRCVACLDLDDRNVERYAVAWIYGRENNFVAA